MLSSTNPQTLRGEQLNFAKHAESCIDSAGIKIQRRFETRLKICLNDPTKFVSVPRFWQQAIPIKTKAFALLRTYKLDFDRSADKVDGYQTLIKKVDDCVQATFKQIAKIENPGCFARLYTLCCKRNKEIDLSPEFDD